MRYPRVLLRPGLYTSTPTPTSPSVTGPYARPSALSCFTGLVDPNVT